MNVSMEFNKKQECLKYCELNKLAFWQRDINANSSKLFIADSYMNIWNNIKEYGPEKSFYYESWSAHTPMKLYIDYDKKNDEKHIEKINDNSHKTDIVNIINAIMEVLPNITSISIMKSIPDIEKRSYHIIFEGMHFTKAKTIDTFMKEQIKPKFRELFDKKIIDTSVYDPKCFRTLLSTKCGQNRPLYLLDTKLFLTELQEVVIPAEETSYEQFLKHV